MTRVPRILLSVVLILLALVPWADTILNLTNQNIRGSAPPLPYESIDDIDDTVFTWRVYWHIAVLIMFWAILFMKDTIAARDKFLWAAGLFFLWPIVSVVFVLKHIWLVRLKTDEL